MSVVRRVTRNSFYLLASKGIGILFTMILGIYAARKLGDIGYGQYSFVLAFIAYFMVFSSAELQNVIVRELSHKKEESSEILTSSLVFKFVFSWLSVLIILVLTTIFHKQTLLAPIFIAAFCLFPVSIYDSFDSGFRACEKMEFIAITNIVYSLIKTLLGVVVLFKGLGLVALFISFFFSETLRAILIGLFYHYKVQRFVWSFRLSNLKHLFLESYILAIKGIVGIMYYRIDIFLLSVLTSDAKVGLYAAASNIAGLMMLVLSLGSSALFPIMSTFFIHSKEKLCKIYGLLNKYIFVVIPPLVLLVAVYSRQIIRLIYGSEFESANTALAIIIFSIIPVALLTLQGMVILISGEYKKMMRLYLIIDSFKVVLTLFLIRLYGLNGAAIAVVFSDTLAAIIYQGYSLKYIEQRGFIKESLKSIIAFCFILSISGAVIIFAHLNKDIVILLGFTTFIFYIFKAKIINQEEISYIKSVFVKS